LGGLAKDWNLNRSSLATNYRVAVHITIAHIQTPCKDIRLLAFPRAEQQERHETLPRILVSSKIISSAQFQDTMQRLELYKSRNQVSVNAAVTKQAKYRQNPNKNLPKRHMGENDIDIFSKGLIGRRLTILFFVSSA
jgi:hypothetical protein